MTKNPHSVLLFAERIAVRYPSAIDGSAQEETIRLRDIVAVSVERGEYEDGIILHWYLQHRHGWTLHFNDRFDGAATLSSALQSIFGFSLPPIDAIAGPGKEGTLLWSTPKTAKRS